MFNTLVLDSFVNGNIMLTLNKKQVSNIQLKDIINFIEKIDLNQEGFIWRFHTNYKYIISLYDIANYYQDLLEILEKFVNRLEKEKKVTKNNNIDLDKIDEKELNFLCILTIIDDCRIKIRTEINNAEENKKIYNYFDNKFKEYLNFLNRIILTIDYNFPFENDLWIPYWKLSLDGKNLLLNDINIYTDIYLEYNNIKFNIYMKDNIKKLFKRIEFLQSKPGPYYNKIKTKFNKLSEKIFNIFPYNIVYSDYRELLFLKEEVIFKPIILNELKAKNINDDIWLLSIIPNYLVAYFLGFPVISSDVPQYKNYKHLLDIIINNNYQFVLPIIKKLAYSKIKLLSFDISCGNNTDEDGDYTDLLFNKVIDYNIDDFILIYNTGIYHLFTAPEFKNIIKKESNPYNREKIPLTSSIFDNIKFKKNVRRYFNNRYLELEFDKTLLDNFEEIKEKIKENNYSKHDYTNIVIPNNILDLIFHAY